MEQKRKRMSEKKGRKENQNKRTIDERENKQYGGGEKGNTTKGGRRIAPLPVIYLIS